MLNDYTRIATYFAGIVRTAYMYCPTVMLTDAQLLDGMFFPVTGPRCGQRRIGKVTR